MGQDKKGKDNSEKKKGGVVDKDPTAASGHLAGGGAGAEGEVAAAVTKSSFFPSAMKGQPPNKAPALEEIKVALEMETNFAKEGESGSFTKDAVLGSLEREAQKAAEPLASRKASSVRAALASIKPTPTPQDTTEVVQKE